MQCDLNRNGFRLSARSILNLQGVNPILMNVVHRALMLTTQPICVIEGVRNKARQLELYNQGKTQTLNSRHLTGHAVDLAPLVDGVIPWESWQAFEKLAGTMKQAAKLCQVSLIWGGDWIMRDGPHFELDRKEWP